MPFSTTDCSRMTESTSNSSMSAKPITPTSATANTASSASGQKKFALGFILGTASLCKIGSQRWP